MLKTLVLLTLIIYFIPVLGFCIVHFRNFEKAWVKIKWWSIIYLVGIFGILTEPLLFWPAYLLRRLKKWNPFWLWLDDSRFDSNGKYAKDYESWLKLREETWWTAFLWHMRNRVWNLEQLIAPKREPGQLEEMVIDDLYMNGKKVDQMSPWVPMAKICYWLETSDGWVEGWWITKGKKISFTWSIFGTGYLWERKNKRLTFRYSKIFTILQYYIVLKFGENDKRQVFSLKFKKRRVII